MKKAQNRGGSDSCEEPRGAAAEERKGCPVFCPKPRRPGQPGGAAPARPRRVHPCYNAEPSGLVAGAELLDLLLSKSVEQSPTASSPPFFNGSPPCRAENPVVHDPRFGEQRPVGSLMPAHSQTGSASLRKGCSPAKLGLKPAVVRVEGFDCLGHNRRRHGITAIA